MKKIFFIFMSISISFSAFSEDFIDEILVNDDPYIGVMVDFSEYQPMVSLSNITSDLTPSKYVMNVDNLITSLAQAKTAKKEFFKNENKQVEFIDSSSKFKVKNVLKTAVYKDNIPDEYTTYILEDDKGKIYAMPDFELKEVGSHKLTSYEQGLMDSIKEQQNYARVIVYLKKPPLYKDKYAPFKQEDLQPVFDYFLDRISSYKKDKVLLSQRNFRLSMNITADTLAYLISEFNNLYIEDIEIVSPFKKIEDDNSYDKGSIRYKKKAWYDK